MKKKLGIAAIAYIGLILLCVFVLYIIPSIRGILVRTYIVEQGEISLSDEVDAYFVRDETVYTAGKACKLSRLSEEHELISAYTRAVEIGDGGAEELDEKYEKPLKQLGEAVIPTTEGTTEKPGYVCYKIDGQESKLTPDTMGELKKSQFEASAEAKQISCAKGQCAKGSPIYRIVNNGRWYAVCYVDKSLADRYIEGDSVKLSIGKNKIAADIISVTKEKGELKLIARCIESYDGFLDDRCRTITLISSDAKGLLLENRSIVKKDGKQGVLVKNKLGNYVFKPICVKSSDGEKSVVYQDIYMDEGGNFVETIGIYDEIVASPSKEQIKNAE